MSHETWGQPNCEIWRQILHRLHVLLPRAESSDTSPEHPQVRGFSGSTRRTSWKPLYSQVPYGKGHRSKNKGPRRLHRAEFRSVPNPELLLSLGCVSLCPLSELPTREAHLNSSVQGFCLGFHFISLLYWSSPWSLASPTFPSLEVSLIPQGLRGPPWVTSLSCTIRGGLRGPPPWITKTLLSLRKFQRVQRLLPNAGRGIVNKGQIFLWARPNSLLHT